MFMLEDSTSKHASLPQIINIFNTTSIKITGAYFIDIDKVILKIKFQRNKIC